MKHNPQMYRPAKLTLMIFDKITVKLKSSLFNITYNVLMDFLGLKQLQFLNMATLY